MANGSLGDSKGASKVAATTVRNNVPPARAAKSCLRLEAAICSKPLSFVCLKEEWWLEVVFASTGIIWTLVALA